MTRFIHSLEAGFALASLVDFFFVDGTTIAISIVIHQLIFSANVGASGSIESLARWACTLGIGVGLQVCWAGDAVSISEEESWQGCTVNAVSH